MTTGLAGIEKMIEEKTGEQVNAVEWMRTGVNSQSARIQTKSQRRFFVKLYQMPEGDHRNRLQNEFSSFTFLWKEGIRSIPEPIFMDVDLGVSILGYVDGEHFQPDDIRENHLDEALRFYSDLQTLRPKAKSCPAASEACFTIQSHSDLIQERLRILTEVQHPDLQAWIQTGLNPLWDRICSAVHIQSRKLGYQDSELAHEKRVLSPSDVGFHNILKERNSERMIFIDFEYFGWDDPVKMVSDFMLESAVPLPDYLRTRWVDKFAAAFSFTREDRQRLALLFPILSFKWCLIILNVFRPNRRPFLKGNEDAILNGQLQKCRIAANIISEELERSYA